MISKTHALPDDRLPVIVGVGEISDHPREITQGLEPLALMQAALKAAERDARAALIKDIDSIELINFLSWRYRDPEQQLCRRLGIAPKRAVYGPVGGESPVRYIHEAAQRIVRGESTVAAICGAEAQGTATKAERAGIELPWTPFAHDVPPPKRAASFQHEMSRALNIARPITVYPLYDAASAVKYGQTPREALRESGAGRAILQVNAERSDLRALFVLLPDECVLGSEHHGDLQLPRTPPRHQPALDHLTARGRGPDEPGRPGARHRAVAHHGLQPGR